MRDVLHCLQRQGQSGSVVTVGRGRHVHYRLRAVDQMGVSAIVGLGNKSDLDEDDLLTFFEQDPNTQVLPCTART